MNQQQQWQQALHDDTAPEERVRAEEREIRKHGYYVCRRCFSYYMFTDCTEEEKRICERCKNEN